MSVRRVRRKTQAGAYRQVWMVDIDLELPDGRRKRVRKCSVSWNKRDAERYEREVRRNLLDGTYGTGEGHEVPTVREFAKEFLEVYAKNNNKPSTVVGKEMVLRVHIKPFFGRLKLDEVTPRHVERFKARKLKAGLSKKSINNYLTCLRRMLAVAYEWGIIQVVPRFQWFKCPKPPFDFLDFDEAERLVEAAEPESKAMIITALKTGMRLGELVALRWEDVDLVKGQLRVVRSATGGHIGTPKSGRNRVIPLSTGLVRVLREHRHLKGELVFCAADGRMLNKNMVRRPIARACRLAGLRNIGWHKLRHTFASHLVMRGAQMKTVQELLGHATMEMTMRYAHLAPRVRREAVNLLDLPVPELGEVIGIRN